VWLLGGHVPDDPETLAARLRGPFGQRRNGANLRRPYGFAEQGLSKAAMVALRGGSSNQTSRFSRLAGALPTLLGRRLRSRHVRKRQVQRRLTPKEIEQLLTEYRAGDSMQELTRKWRLLRTTVTEHLRRSSIAVRHRGIPTERLDEVIRLYGDGWSCQRLAERYGCDDETVRQSLKRLGVRLRKPWKRV
jgi:hypothetical protein